jgi:hypothetical protein
VFFSFLIHRNSIYLHCHLPHPLPSKLTSFNRPHVITLYPITTDSKVSTIKKGRLSIRKSLNFYSTHLTIFQLEKGNRIFNLKLPSFHLISY